MERKIRLMLGFKVVLNSWLSISSTSTIYLKCLNSLSIPIDLFITETNLNNFHNKKVKRNIWKLSRFH